jgi:hypothetical protein
VRRNRRAALLATGLFAVSLAGCETLMNFTEVAGPTVLAIGNALLTVAAANYSGEYSTHVQALVSGFTQSSQTALQAFLAQRRERRMLTAEAAAQAPPLGAYPATPASSVAIPPPPPDEQPFPPAGAPPSAPPQAAPVPATAPPAAAAPAPSPAGPQPISLDVALLKKSGPTAEDVAPLPDGGVVRGDPSGGADRFRVYFKPNVASYVYVVAIDATGWVQPVFPTSFGPDLAPTSPDATTLLPDPTHWFAVDAIQGVYHVYFVASQQRRKDLEAQLQDFLSRTRVMPPAPRAVEQPVVVEQAWVAERGGEITSRGVVSEVVTRDGSYQVTPESYSFGVQGADLVVTRYFRVE